MPAKSNLSSIAHRSAKSHASLDLSDLHQPTAATVQQIITDHPQFRFRRGPKFAFHPPKTIILGPPEPKYTLLALHGHALCKHHHASTHVQRLKIESEAWYAAKRLCLSYGISYDEDFAEDQLDTYRDWLHTKSACPTCRLTRFQTPDGKYQCPRCDLL